MRNPLGGSWPWITALSLCVLGLGGVFGVHLTEAGQAPNPETKKRVSAAIDQGRKLAAQGKNTEAIAAFQSALGLDPNAARALSELGLAYYRLKQYPEGEAAMRKAIKATSDPAHRGRSLYNLGLILEAKGDSKRAGEMYQESLKTRTNQVVLERLRKLDPAAAAALDPVAPRRLRGPFPQLPAVCQALNDCKKRMSAELSYAGPVYRCRANKPLSTMKSPAAPYLAVELFETRCEPRKDEGSGYEGEIYLGVQTEKGWFVDDVAGQFMNDDGGTGTEITVQELSLTPGAQGGKRVLLKYKESYSHEFGPGGSESSESEKIIIIGIGPSGVASATPPLVMSLRETSDPSPEDEEEGAKHTVDVNAKLNLNLQGDELELTAKTSPKSIAKAQVAPLGKHLLVFP